MASRADFVDGFVLLSVRVLPIILEALTAANARIADDPSLSDDVKIARLLEIHLALTDIQESMEDTLEVRRERRE